MSRIIQRCALLAFGFLVASCTQQLPITAAQIVEVPFDNGYPSPSRDYTHSYSLLAQLPTHDLAAALRSAMHIHLLVKDCRSQALIATVQPMIGGVSLSDIRSARLRVEAENSPQTQLSGTFNYRAIGPNQSICLEPDGGSFALGKIRGAPTVATLKLAPSPVH